jgi:PAS domain S-box-containing protein
MAEEILSGPVQEAILNAKREWEAIFDSVSDLLILVDEKGIIRRVNKATINMFNTSYLDLLGKELNSLMEYPAFEFKQDSKPIECKFSGVDAIFSTSITEVNIEGQERKFIFVMHDITRERENEAIIARQKQYYESLWRYSTVAIVSVDLEDRKSTRLNSSH